MMKQITEEELQELARQKRAEYSRNWRKKNPDAYKKHIKTYWEKRVLKELNNQK